MRDRQEGRTFQASDRKVCHRFEKHGVGYLALVRGSCSQNGVKERVEEGKEKDAEGTKA